MSEKTRRTRALAAGAGVAVAALALAGCTTTATPDAGASSGGTITIATTNAFTSFNGDTPEANLDTNGMVGYLTADGQVHDQRGPHLVRR